MSRSQTVRCLAVFLLIGLAISPSVVAMGTAFTYQGHLTDDGFPAHGGYDFEFVLFDQPVSGSQVGSILTGDDVTVDSGYFLVDLDFGSGIFQGDSLWLEIRVSPDSAVDPYTPLLPRQPVQPSPYALHSGSVSWNDIVDMPADFADGVDADSGGDITEVIPGSGLSGGGGSGAVTVGIATGGVTSDHLATSSVGAAEIAAGAVGTSEVADDSLTSSDLAAGSVGSSEVANNSLTSSDLGAGSVGISELAANTVQTGHVQDGTITYSDTDTDSVQRRVTGSCGTNYSIDTVSSNGLVACEYDDYNEITFSSTEHHVGASGGASDAYSVSALSGRRMCFLTRVNFREIDSTDEDAICDVTYSGGNWTLLADTDGDAAAYCSMLCITWESTGRQD